MSPEPVPAAIDTDPIALLFPELDLEMAVTRSLLGAVPWERAAWKPHPKSMSLGQLAVHVAQLPNFATAIAATDVLNFDPVAFAAPAIANTNELLALFDSEVVKLRAALGALDWTRLGGNWKMVMGENVFLDGQRALMIRHVGINHLVHHRAQLGVFLRLLDVPLPGSYGPSADTK